MRRIEARSGSERLPERLLDEDRPARAGAMVACAVSTCVPSALWAIIDLAASPSRRAGERGLDVSSPGRFVFCSTRPISGSAISALPVHHEGLARAPDLDLGHHVPDELEVDLRDGDPAGRCRCQRPPASCRAPTPSGSTPARSRRVRPGLRLKRVRWRNPRGCPPRPWRAARSGAAPDRRRRAGSPR